MSYLKPSSRWNELSMNYELSGNELLALSCIFQYLSTKCMTNRWGATWSLKIQTEEWGHGFSKVKHSQTVCIEWSLASSWIIHELFHYQKSMTNSRKNPWTPLAFSMNSPQFIDIFSGATRWCPSQTFVGKKIPMNFLFDITPIFFKPRFIGVMFTKWSRSRTG